MCVHAVAGDRATDVPNPLDLRSISLRHESSSLGAGAPDRDEIGRWAGCGPGKGTEENFVFGVFKNFAEQSRCGPRLRAWCRPGTTVGATDLATGAKTEVGCGEIPWRTRAGRCRAGAKVALHDPGAAYRPGDGREERHLFEVRRTSKAGPLRDRRSFGTRTGPAIVLRHRPVDV